MEEAEEAGTREVVRRVQGRVLDPRETTTTTSELLATVATEEGEQVDVSLGSTSIARTDSTSGRNDEIQVWISYDSGGTGIDRKTTILRMMPSETIADVKLRVQARKGWFASQQRLTFGDMELDDAKTIDLVARAAGIHDAVGVQGAQEGPNHVHLSVHLSDILNVRIKTLQGEQLVSAQPESTVAHLKEAVSLLPDGYLPDHQHVFLNGKMLDDSQQLAQVGLSESAIVHVLVKRTTKVRILPRNGSQFELSISAVETVHSLKQRIEAAQGIAAAGHRVSYNGQYLPESASLAAYGVDKDSVLVLEPHQDHMLKSCGGLDHVSASLEKCVNMLTQAQAGFDSHMAPCLASAGTGGAYFLLGPSGNKVAVFKPEDEEPNAANNPRGIAGSHEEGLRRGTRPGEGALREFAAFLLDHNAFAGVPPTAMVSLKQSPNMKYAAVDWHGSQGKRGSLQVFVPSEADCEEQGVSQIATGEVHKISILDIRLGNTDRNGSNVLMVRGEGEECTLVPIDHGYCLPGSFADISFEWLYWPQAKRPFDDAMVAYVRGLDVERDLEVLAAHGVALRPECELVFRVTNMLLSHGIARGLTAFDMGSILCRERMQQSIMERLSNRALKVVSTRDKDVIQGTGKLRLTELQGPLKSLYIQQMDALLTEYLDENV